MECLCSAISTGRAIHQIPITCHAHGKTASGDGNGVTWPCMCMAFGRPTQCQGVQCCKSAVPDCAVPWPCSGLANCLPTECCRCAAAHSEVKRVPGGLVQGRTGHMAAQLLVLAPQAPVLIVDLQAEWQVVSCEAAGRHISRPCSSAVLGSAHLTTQPGSTLGLRHAGGAVTGQNARRGAKPGLQDHNVCRCLLVTAMHVTLPLLSHAQVYTAVLPCIWCMPDKPGRTQGRCSM